MKFKNLWISAISVKKVVPVSGMFLLNAVSNCWKKLLQSSKFQNWFLLEVKSSCIWQIDWFRKLVKLQVVLDWLKNLRLKTFKTPPHFRAEIHKALLLHFVVTIVPLLFPTLYGKRVFFTYSPWSWVLCPLSFSYYNYCLPCLIILTKIHIKTHLIPTPVCTGIQRLAYIFMFKL